MTNVILLLIVSILGSFIQSITGFGCAILAMSILPLVLPFKTAAVAMALAALVMTFKVSFSLRENINYRILVIPFIASLAGRTIGVHILNSYDTNMLQKILGILLILLSLWFIFFNHAVKLEANSVTGLSAGLASGILGGLCNISGPPLVIYFFSVLKEKKEYNATIQATFFLGGLYTILLHILYGNITEEIVKLSAVAVVGVAIGSSIGLAMFSKINKKILSRIIYSFIMVMGIVMLL